MSSKNPQEASRSIDDIKEAIKEALTDGQPSEAFCKAWPYAKTALEELLTQIPVNPTTQPLIRCINNVIKVGDEYFMKCGQ